MAINEQLKRIMQADLDAIAADWPEVLTFRGSTLAGTFSPVDSSDSIDEAGIIKTASATFVANRDLYEAMASKPVERDSVTVDGTVFYVGDIVLDPACVTISLRRN
jgi:hypothetical protein